MKNKHEIVPECLIAYVDGQLVPSKREWVEAHLKTCAQCRSLVADLAKLNRAVEDAESLEVKDAYFDVFASRVASRIAQRGMNRKKKPIWSVLRWVGVPLAATATLAIAVIVSLALFSKDEKPLTYTIKAERPREADKDECAPLPEAGRTRSKMAPLAAKEEKVLAVRPHLVKEVATIVIHLPEDGHRTLPPEISSAIEIDLPNGG